ncbi:MAG: hydroxyphenylacetyl-CoA thioesterase PaaI [Anaerolineae bacterium]|nr:hydroxyphenylacetyl-CoA thioesterase PaaI [Anaerolineae bacterium]
MSRDVIFQKLRQDPFAQFLGIELLDMRDGYAKTALTVQENMLNAHGTPHGGVVFSLADAAFAAASNSHGQVAVALDVDIHFVTAASLGTRLYAEATEEHLGHRIALYRLAVTTEDGTLIALCHGTVYRKEQSLV